MIYNVADKMRAIELYRAKRSISNISKELNIPRSNIVHWVRTYKHLGISGLKGGKYKYYPSTEKREAMVREVLENNLSCTSVGLKHGISISSVSRWVAQVKSEGYGSLARLSKYNPIPLHMRKLPKPQKHGAYSEIDRLQRDNQLLRAEIDYLKKLQTLVGERIARESRNKSKSSKS